jgi:hypothetical protein
MISFLSRTIDFFFFFLSFLWIYLWLAETSQQPISQTTWLKVTPHWVVQNAINILSNSVLVAAVSSRGKLKQAYREN